MAFSRDLLLSITGQQTVMMSKENFDSLKINVPVRDTYCRQTPYSEGKHCVIVTVREMQDALEKATPAKRVTPNQSAE